LVDTYLKFRFSGFSLTKNGINKIIAGKFVKISEIEKKSALNKPERITTNSQGINSIETKKIIRNCIEIRF
jgi:hypothetical protein